jgi:hypothetical protein
MKNEPPPVAERPAHIPEPPSRGGPHGRVVEGYVERGAGGVKVAHPLAAVT